MEEEEGSNQDILSNLDEDILHHILSFLDTREVIQTSILSSRWRYLWKSFPFLKFNNDEYFVDNVMSNRDKSSKIKSFRISYPEYVPGGTSRCFKWINTVVECGVEEVYACIPLEDQKLPLNPLFVCQSLKILELESKAHVYLPDLINLPRLTKLVLKDVQLEGKDDVIKKIVSSCPMLESLSLLDCKLDNTIFDIYSLQLKHLIFNIDGEHIKLYAPNLISLESQLFVIQTHKVCLLQSLPTFMSLRNLILSGHIFDSMSLPSLQKLVLRWVHFGGKGDIIQKILLDCPVLESLSLEYCELDGNILDISSIQLKHLSLQYCEDLEYIKLNAPNLISFDCIGVKWKYFDVIGGLDALAKAEIDLAAIDEEFKSYGPFDIPPVIDEKTRKVYSVELIKMLKAFYNVETLISPSILFLQVLSQARLYLEESNTILEFSKLRRLNLSVWLLKDCADTIIYLLEICPKIELLHLTTEATQSYDRTPPISSSLQCMLYHLKYIKIIHNQGSPNSDDIRFLEILLKNSPVLETVELNSTSRGWNRTTETLNNLPQKLQALPRASPKSVIFLVIQVYCTDW